MRRAWRARPEAPHRCGQRRTGRAEETRGLVSRRPRARVDYFQPNVVSSACAAWEARMAIDRDKFLAGVVSGGPLTGRLKVTQLKGMNAILDAWEASGLPDLRWLAYMFATVL